MDRVVKSICALVVFLVCSQAWAETEWQQIDASTPFTDQNGIQRSPSCSGGPTASNTDFSFFFREGNPRKLLIALDGGGACWDPNTCIGSPLAGNPIYNLEVDETPEGLAEVGGVGDIDSPNNPFSDYSLVFVPYCTGDIHWGSNDKTYLYTPPGGTTIPWTIHHRGYDNYIAVLEWLTQHYNSYVRHAPQKVVLAGGSAGGYGVLLGLPALKERLPRSTQTYLLADSANGVISDNFYNRALGGHDLSGGVWGIEQNLPEFLLGAFASGAETLAISTYTTLAWRYPFTRFGQYTHAWDETQIFYFNVMKQVDFPERWTDPGYLSQAALEWTIKARAYMQFSALAPNYRYYIGAGNEHTLLADDSFYTENSAEAVYLSDWVDAMTKKRGRSWVSRNSDWRNVSCAPNCLGQ